MIVSIHDKKRAISIYFKETTIDEKQATKGLTWTKENLDRNWDNVFFMSELSFCAFLSKTESTERFEQLTVKSFAEVLV